MEDKERKIIIDEDWKKEAQKEKELLAEKERQQDQQAARSGGLPQADFVGLVNMLATQAFFALGLLRLKGQPQQPPDLEAARYNIDMLGILEQKTKGNLQPEEVQMLVETLHNLRLAFVEVSKQLQV